METQARLSVWNDWHEEEEGPVERRPRAGLAEPSSTRAGNVCMCMAMCECIYQRENVCVHV